ncbi:MAG: cobyrinate a,c-diamide synthase, partial [Lysobacterales bacterium]
MSAATCPAILIAAPASGQGKTTVACALARLHARQGRRVRVFKCGPDFLDPYWLTLASGAPVHQLDLWMTGEADCAQRLHEAALEADLIIVEGVMGLFDGQPSAADLAQRFGLPVLAVIDASAMAGTFGALAWGLQHYREGLRFAGVLANRVASPGHAAMLEDGLREPAQWQGALMRDAAFTLPERHLGLVMANELGDAMQRLDAAADALAAAKLGQMSADDLQAWSVTFEADDSPQEAFPAGALQGQTIAVARDAAFCFLYAANLDCLQALGARLAYFSPLADTALPPCDALWLPGGYPELHAGRLAASHGFRRGMRAAAQRGAALYGECGGYMVLGEGLIDASGRRHAMAALLPVETSFAEPRLQLGYRALRLASPSPLGAPGDRLAGHEFHYATLGREGLLPALFEAADAAGRRLGRVGLVKGRIMGSFIHLI